MARAPRESLDGRDQFAKRPENAARISARNEPTSTRSEATGETIRQSGTGAWERLRQSYQGDLAPGYREIPIRRPRAAVLACSDARVPPSLIFDQPAGSLFVVRIAGNTASSAALASLGYAVEILGVELVVVLGHTDCGAVAAAAAGACGGHLRPVTEAICEVARRSPGAGVDQLAVLNVAHTVAALLADEGPIGKSARDGSIEIRGALHDLVLGQLTDIEPATPFRNQFFEYKETS